MLHEMLYIMLRKTLYIMLLLSWLALAATHAVSLFVPLSIGRVITKVAL
jgi:hypothetical protein